MTRFLDVLRTCDPMRLGAPEEVTEYEEEARELARRAMRESGADEVRMRMLAAEVFAESFDEALDPRMLDRLGARIACSLARSVVNADDSGSGGRLAVSSGEDRRASGQ